MNIPDFIKTAFRSVLARQGYRIQRLTPKDRLCALGYDPGAPLPLSADSELRPDNPQLCDLERRYQGIESPICSHSQWQPKLNAHSMNLRYFRGESPYLWSYIKLNGYTKSYDLIRHKYYIYASYIRGLDHRDLLGRVLSEDGAFGCFTFRFDLMPVVSRDLLDSVNEIYFLDRNWGLFARSNLKVLDIGAGYGRLAHRMLNATENVSHYWCIDAIARSTFLCEYYLTFRGLLGQANPRAFVVPLDQMNTTGISGIDLAINIHSFSEMSYAAVKAWVEWLSKLNVPSLLIVPNEPEMLTQEADGTRVSYLGLLEEAGYRINVQEPTIRDADVKQLFGVGDYFFLLMRE